MKIFLVRHPPPLVAAGVCYGSSDVACAPVQLAATLATLRAQLPPISADTIVFSSPLQRCAGLALALTDGLSDGLSERSSTPRFDARLVELDFGAWEMQRWDDIARAEVDAWAADVLHYRPGGGETLLSMAQRVHDFYRELLACSETQAQAIIVCHAGSMRLLAACQPDSTVQQIALRAAAKPHQLAYGAVLTLDI